MRVSGDTCNGYGALNGDYYYQGTTADGKHYYAHDTKTSHLIARYLYYDEDQDGPGEKGWSCEAEVVYWRKAKHYFNKRP